MQDMIKRIIDMDTKAQEITRQAQQEKIDAEKEIAESVRKMREEMLSRARRRIQINRENENTILEQNWKKTKVAFDEQSERLESLYREKGGEWADALVRRTLDEL